MKIGDPKPVLDDDALYWCDNGAVRCGAHSGASAYYTGRDISGQRVERVTEADRIAARTGAGGHRWTIRCERCGRE